jgi:hypothetical protein
MLHLVIWTFKFGPSNLGFPLYLYVKVAIIGRLKLSPEASCLGFFTIIVWGSLYRQWCASTTEKPRSTNSCSFGTARCAPRLERSKRSRASLSSSAVVCLRWLVWFLHRHTFQKIVSWGTNRMPEVSNVQTFWFRQPASRFAWGVS